MSQRSAAMAAAIATAEVSDPPRPSVVMRPVSLCTPWKPASTATSWRSLKRLTSSAPLTSRTRAAAWALEVMMGNCQPCHERALTPIPSSTMANRPAVTCSPEDTTASYSRASCSAAASRHQPTSRSVAPAMAETTTATSWPASTSRLTCRATLRMRSRSATDVPPNFITSRAMTVPDAPKGVNKQSVQARKVRAPARKGAYTYRRCATTATSALQRRSSHEEPWLNDAIHRLYPAARRDGGVYDHFALGGVSTGDWPLAAGLHRLDGGWRSRSGLAIGRNGLRAVWSWSGLQRVVSTLDNGNRRD